jgi:hypothetical protein
MWSVTAQAVPWTAAELPASTCALAAAMLASLFETKNVQSLCVADVPTALVQVYDILNSLEDRLGVNSSAVVLAAMKVLGCDRQLTVSLLPGLHGLGCWMTRVAHALLLPYATVCKAHLSCQLC